MSAAEERAAIVAQLEKVPGVGPTPGQPAAIMPGSAWPARVRTEWPNACVTRRTWYVFLALPAGEQGATIEAADDLVDDVAQALWVVAKVNAHEPWQIPIEPGQQGVPVERYQLEM